MKPSLLQCLSGNRVASESVTLGSAEQHPPKGSGPSAETGSSRSGGQMHSPTDAIPENGQSLNTLATPLNQISVSLQPVGPAVENISKNFAVKKGRHWTIALIFALLPASWTFENYLETQFESRVSRSQTDFNNITQQLTSDSPAIRSIATRDLYLLAFRPFPLEGTTGPAAPFVNMCLWIIGRREYRFLDVSRHLFKEYAVQSRAPLKSTNDVVSTTFLQTAIEWRHKESELFQKDPNSSDLWLLEGANLRSAYGPSLHLESFQLAGANLTNAKLPNAKLTEANLQQSILDGADFQSSILDRANLQTKSGNGTHFAFASLKDVLAGTSHFERADFTLADLTRANFTAAVLSKSTFRTATLSNAKFTSADLRETNFSGSDLSGVDFTNANLDKADFRFAVNLYKVSSWRGAKNLRKARFPMGFHF
jgi:uncharacterized protein YjbI with pentapeptide repeats